VNKSRQVKIGTGQEGTEGPENGRTYSERSVDDNDEEQDDRQQDGSRRTRQRTNELPPIPPSPTVSEDGSAPMADG
jgi:hypothetical protein